MGRGTIKQGKGREIKKNIRQWKKNENEDFISGRGRRIKEQVEWRKKN